ncbi:MAG: hypothetical protein Q9227_000465 [Pyrenula ochraceoflavens]
MAVSENGDDSAPENSASPSADSVSRKRRPQGETARPSATPSEAHSLNPFSNVPSNTSAQRRSRSQSPSSRSPSIPPRPEFEGTPVSGRSLQEGDEQYTGILDANTTVQPENAYPSPPELEDGEIDEHMDLLGEKQGPDINVARPTHVISENELGQRPPKKRPWRTTDDGPQPLPSCRCAISENCPHIPADRLDCRTYAPIPKRPKTQVKIDSLVKFERLDRHLYSDAQSFRRHQRRIQTEGCGGQDLRNELAALRQWIKRMTFTVMNQEIVDATFIIHGLRAFISFGKRNTDTIPVDIIEDLLVLKRKWRAKIWDLDPLRGIVVRLNNKDGYDRSLSRRLEKEYSFRKTASYFGHNNLVNGQCWPNQICMVRDGAHGSLEGGIYGNTRNGAFSIVLSNPSRRFDYADRDEGDRIYFASTSLAVQTVNPDDYEADGNNGTSHRDRTQATNVMFASIANKNPVRLFRSFRLPDIDKFRPRDGFRYDGLYKVKKAEQLDKALAVYRFRLDRVDKQNPIRLDRPWNEEMEDWLRIRMQTKRARKGGDAT